MMGIGFSELMIILIIIMIIFGAGKLPEIGTAFGNTIRNFKKSMKETEESDEAVEQAAQEVATDSVPGTLTEGVAESEHPATTTSEPSAENK